MIIRPPKREEIETLKVVVQSVVDEIYGYLWTSSSPDNTRAVIASRIWKQDWSQAWVAVEGETLVGTVLTRAKWIEDLWVINSFRGRGIGRQLLLRGEAEIVERGYRTLRLRMVKANKRALAFYRRVGWHVGREFPHEALPFIKMVELSKKVDESERAHSM
jgi:ribosomal protein S18 acetylase RimI-like enzyme